MYKQQQRARQENQKRAALSNVHHSTQKSEKLVGLQKQTAFKELFKLLDSDKDGQISGQKICVFELPEEVIDILTPLFDEMEEEGHVLDVDEFTGACGRLYQTLSIHEKNILVKSKKLTDQLQK